MPTIDKRDTPADDIPNKKEYNIENILHALEIYESDFKHRDNYMTKEMYTIFFAGLFCNVIPFILPKSENISLNPALYFVFPAVALFITVYFWFYAMACAARVHATTETIEELMKLLPEKLRRVKLEKTPFAVSSMVTKPMSLWTPAWMCSALFAFDAAMVCILLYDRVLDNACAILLIIIWALIVAVFVLLICMTVNRYKVKKNKDINLPTDK